MAIIRFMIPRFVIKFPNIQAEGFHEISIECSAVFEALKLRRKHRYIIYRIGETCIEVEKVGGRAETFADFKSSLPYTDARYGIFDQEYKTHDGRPASKLWFVSWLPNNSTPYNKMAYTSAKGKFRESLPGVFDVQSSTVEELESALGLAAAADEEDNEFDD